MSDEPRDPDIQALFAAAGRELPGDDFTDRVMARLRERQRIGRLAGAGLALFAVVIAGLLAAPAGQLAVWLAGALTQPLVPLAGNGLAPLLAPLNSVGFAIALALFAFWRLWRLVSV